MPFVNGFLQSLIEVSQLEFFRILRYAFNVLGHEFRVPVP